VGKEAVSESIQGRTRFDDTKVNANWRRQLRFLQFLLKFSQKSVKFCVVQRLACDSHFSPSVAARLKQNKQVFCGKGAKAMKRVLLGIVAAAALMIVPAAAQAGGYHGHGHGHGHGNHHQGYYRGYYGGGGGGWGCRPPVAVYRPIYPVYPPYGYGGGFGGGGTSFYYNGPRSSFGFGF
jgi:hypothetical protein